ncbi:MAG: radical SAM protein, partial [Bdellovibrionota bacterium]
MIGFFERIQDAVISKIGNGQSLPLQIDITNSCNLRCTHCYHEHHNNRGALSFTQWVQVLEQYSELLRKTGFAPYIIICGGEPTLSPVFNPLLTEIWNRFGQCRLAILSNGTTSQNIKLEPMKLFDDLTVQVSFDGANAETHDEIRGKGSFEKAINGVRAFQAAGLSVEILTVLSKRSALHIEEFFRLASFLKSKIGFSRLILNGYAKDLKESGVDRPLRPSELRQAYSEVLYNIARFKVPASTHSPLFHLLHPAIGRNARYWQGLVVSYKGEVLASSRSRLILGDVFTDGLEKIFLSHPLLVKLRKGEIDECGTCPDFRKCGGDRNAAYAETGNFL